MVADPEPNGDIVSNHPPRRDAVVRYEIGDWPGLVVIEFSSLVDLQSGQIVFELANIRRD